VAELLLDTPLRLSERGTTALSEVFKRLDEDGDNKWCEGCLFGCFMILFKLYFWSHALSHLTTHTRAHTDSHTHALRSQKEFNALSVLAHGQIVSEEKMREVREAEGVADESGDVSLSGWLALSLQQVLRGVIERKCVCMRTCACERLSELNALRVVGDT
jgi:hypothetical protein